MNLNKIVALALLGAGTGLFFFGWRSYGSIAASFGSAVTEASTDNAFWLLGLGVLAGATGLFSLFFRGAR